MDLNNVTDAITTWQEEDNNNRSVLVIAIERKAGEQGKTTTDARISVQGNKETVKTVMKHLLQSGESPEMQELLLKTFLESYIEMINEKLITKANNENKEEE